MKKEPRLRKQLGCWTIVLVCLSALVLEMANCAATGSETPHVNRRHRSPSYDNIPPRTIADSSASKVSGEDGSNSNGSDRSRHRTQSLGPGHKNIRLPWLRIEKIPPVTMEPDLLSRQSRSDQATPPSDSIAAQPLAKVRKPPASVLGRYPPDLGSTMADKLGESSIRSSSTFLPSRKRPSPLILKASVYQGGNGKLGGGRLSPMSVDGEYSCFFDDWTSEISSTDEESPDMSTSGDDSDSFLDVSWKLRNKSLRSPKDHASGSLVKAMMTKFVDNERWNPSTYGSRMDRFGSKSGLFREPSVNNPVQSISSELLTQPGYYYCSRPPHN